MTIDWRGQTIVHRPALKTLLSASQVGRYSEIFFVRTPNIPYYLEYSPGLEFNPGKLTHPNWKVEVFSSLDFNPLLIWTWMITDHEIN